MIVTLALTTLVGALAALALVRLLHPVLVRYALARPNARSSHRAPTPQGGGIAVLAAALLAGGGALLVTDWPLDPVRLLAPALLAVVLALAGGADDLFPLPAWPRLLLQLAAVVALVAAVDPARIMTDAVPVLLERALIVLALLWWVNVVNFMDGIDWMTVGQFVPMTFAFAMFALVGWVGGEAGLVAAALLGALIGFAPANRPVARLFLGDVGSLPIGLLSGWLLLELASSGRLWAALLLPLYYLADATVTLLVRLGRREPVWEAHRQHYYQRAVDRGLPVTAVLGCVLALNLALVALATLAAARPGAAIGVPALAAGTALVALVLRLFDRRGQEPSEPGS